MSSRVMGMNRVQSLSSDQEINDGLAEIELQKLQRQYRIMEGDRKAYSEESRIVISKQRATIEKLKRDYQHLQDELRLLEQRNEDRKKNGIQSKKAELMADQADSFQRKIRQIMAEISVLDNHTASMDRDIDQQSTSKNNCSPEKAEKEYQAYIQEIKELDRALEQDRRLKEFMATKVSDRMEKQDGGNQDGLSRKNHHVNNEIEKLAEEIVEIQKRIDAMKVEGVAVEEDRRRTMKSLEDNLEASKEKCIQYETQYNDVTYLLEQLRHGIETIIRLFQQAKLPSLAPKSPSSSTEEDSGKESIEDSENNESEEKPAEADTGAKTDSEFTQATDALLGAHGVTDGNLLSCLGLIEYKTNELLTLHFLLNAPKKSGSGSAASQGMGEDKGDGTKEPTVIQSSGIGGLLGQGPMIPIGNLSIIPPSTGDDHDSDDVISEEDDRPLTREELKQKTLRGLSKREKTAGANKS
ncbi:hypothetical protein BC829DRAFT_416119 [Chytridium lagenaria]|nr:hypothetical protein BC829DRAFT_416119 [Chytridium lagenaria]